MNNRFRLRRTEHDVGDRRLGHLDLAEQCAVRVEAVDAVAGARPDAPVLIEPEPVRPTDREVDEHAAVREAAVVVDVEHTDVAAWRVGDEQAAFVGGEREPVRAFEVVGHEDDMAIGRVDAVHVARADLALGPLALVVAEDPVRRVGEPHHAVVVDDDVVRAVQPLAVPPVGEHRDRTVVLGACDAAAALLAADQPSLAVEGQPVGVVRR